jgi:hypothetical protein
MFAPRDGQRIPSLTLSTDLSFTIRGRGRLQRITAEVIGEHSGFFFTICGGEGQAGPARRSPPCSAGSFPLRFERAVPVFAGDNTLELVATFADGERATVQRQFFVTHFATEAFDKVQPPLRFPPLPENPAEQEPYDPPKGDDARYDLLILTHSTKKTVNNVQVLDGFGKILLPLVHHKNATGMPTILLVLDDLYQVPEYRGRDHAEIIKNAIVDARNLWGIKYVMLVGDCDRFPVRYTRIYDLGAWGYSYAPSDLYYADLFDASANPQSWDYDSDDRFGELQGNFAKDANDLNQDRLDLVPDVAVGRVPASTEDELRTYVKKVIDYETTANAGWFKRALLVTGDYPGSNTTNDHIATQLAARSFATIKLYHDVIWPSTPLSQRPQMIENELNQGVGFLSYVGHGWGVSPPSSVGGGWGGWYDYTAIPFLANPGRLPVIFSAACSTAMFHTGNGPYFAKWGYEYRGADYSGNRFAKYRWGPEPIALSPISYDVDALADHFLVKYPVGGIAFIGAYTGTQGDSHTLAKYFFESYAAGADILGDSWNGALSKFVTNVIDNLAFPADRWVTAARYHHIHKMLLFGDPSLRLGGLRPDLVPLSGGYAGFCNVHDDRLVVTVHNQGAGAAGASTTRVAFGNLGQSSQATPPLSPGQQVELEFPMPPGCYGSSDCGFSITVDQGNQVEESDEGNNAVTGNCVG